MEIRKTTKEDLEQVMQLYQEAREFMAAHGNVTQWGTTNPPQARIEQDILEGKHYVCVDEGQIVGTFYYAKEVDKTYKVIEDGAWKNEKDYAVVHRITAKQGTRGVASFCLDWSYKQYPNLKIDTHRNNLPMQGLLKKNGFEYCGIIHLEDGSERLAYQKCEK